MPAPGMSFNEEVPLGYRNGYYYARGEIEFIIKDRNGNVVGHHREPNIIKIFAKEILAHRAGYSKIWSPTANSGAGAWVSSEIDDDEEFAVKYIMFGASFDSSGTPLGNDDPRFYIRDEATGLMVPLTLEPGAHYQGGLINPIPISEPDRPLKRIEAISFNATYQPTSTPLLQDDVRATNNIVVFETTLRQAEYNGLGLSTSDSFTITEVALVAGKAIDIAGTCDGDPHELFLEGSESGQAIEVTFTGGNVISISQDEPDSSLLVIKEGDQIKITDAEDSVAATDSVNQLSPYYLVVSKSSSGRDLELDRTPVTTDNTPLTGSAGIFRDTMRIFSHRILKSPVPKSADQEIIVRWNIVFS
jgi:hypothetical protein